MTQDPREKFDPDVQFDDDAEPAGSGGSFLDDESPESVQFNMGEPAEEDYPVGSQVEWTSERTGIRYTFRIPPGPAVLQALNLKFVGDQLEVDPVSPGAIRLASQYVWSDHGRPDFDKMKAGEVVEVVSAFISYLF